jgi:Asp-tRNA(Asn)/Glu-tRNA(Gln) amidotransferase A subunit family amidase
LIRNIIPDNMFPRLIERNSEVDIALNQMTAKAAADAIRSGDVTSEALVDACIGRINEREGTVHAWVNFDADHARAQARDADAQLARGEEVGPLHGVPVGLKDIIDTADLPTESGSRLFVGRRPAHDATCAALLRAAGAVILGKTVTTEFALTQARGTTNPHDPTRTPGGSSSGSGAAVADGMVQLAVGSQTGGSVIRPASFCGTYGYKPTYGSISRRGVLIISRYLDHLGLYSRSLEDLAIMGDILMKHDPGDLDMRFHPGCNLVEGMAELGSTAAPRLAFVKGPAWAHAEDHMPPVLEAYVAGLGDVIQEVELGGIFDQALDAQATIMNASLWANLGQMCEQHPDEIEEETKGRVVAGRDILACDYIHAAELVDSLGHALEALFENYDALVTAAAPGEAPVGLEWTGNAAFQRIWTVTGLPTVTLPLLKGPNGMPIGVQVIGPKGGDAGLFRAAHWLDKRAENS